MVFTSGRAGIWYLMKMCQVKTDFSITVNVNTYGCML